MGKVLRPHGLEGVLRVRSYASSPDSFLEAGSVFLKTTAGKIQQFSVISVTPHKNILLMRLEGLNSGTSAEEYREAEVLVGKESLSREADEYFYFELVGLEVFLESGEYLGSVEQVMPTRAHDIYVVNNGEQEILIPATTDVVTDIDLDKGKLIVSAMEGLLDLNEI
jgi:16S rRNA processing protein RimM